MKPPAKTKTTSEKPQKVLLVEDNPMDARLLFMLLSQGLAGTFELVQTARLDEALQHLQEDKFDVVISDLSLPDSQGLETFRQLHAAAGNVPLLVLSGTDDEALAISAVREGAQDYLVKGRVDAHALRRAISYAIERQRVEAALQESEKHYRHLLESITDYSYTVLLRDEQPVVTTHGPGCVNVTGYTCEQYLADPYLWYEMIHEADRPTVLAQASQVLTGVAPPPLEHRIVHKNGGVRWVRNTIVPRRDEQGRLVAYDGLISDITGRKQAEERVTQSEALYHSLVENLPQHILRKDLDSRFTFANQRFCALLGRTLEQIVGKTDFDFFPAALAEKYQQDDQEVMRTGKNFETEEENRPPGGDITYVNVVKTPIRDAQGRITGIQAIFWDITERKLAAQQLQKAHAELARNEQALRKSHEELKSAQLQLIQAEKMESIGTLAAGVAHEVKNPLAILLMGVNFLDKTLPATDENVATVLKEMHEAIARADSITRGLLEFAGSQTLAVTAEDLNQVLEQTFRLVRHEMAKQGVALIKELGEGLPQVGADKNQIQQVFVNVFMNAIHAMPHGGTLTVRTYEKELTETAFFQGARAAAPLWVGDRVVVVEVDDTGTGIAEENMSRIFDPFFTTKPTGVGTGLGLPVTKKIIELHGGTIDIKNIPGGGVRVAITLKAKGAGK